jgi:ketosteroid isomerase-like protein
MPSPASRAFLIALPLFACDDRAVSDIDAIRALIEAQVDAFRRKDAAAAVALLADGVVAFEMIPPLVMPPESARSEQAMAGWFAGWDGPITIEIRDLAIHATGDVAFSHSLNRLAGTRLGGGQTDIWMRSTLGFRHTEDGWRIIHGHTSVPFDPMDGFRARLDLKP